MQQLVRYNYSGYRSLPGLSDSWLSYQYKLAVNAAQCCTVVMEHDIACPGRRAAMHWRRAGGRHEIHKGHPAGASHTRHGTGVAVLEGNTRTEHTLKNTVVGMR